LKSILIIVLIGLCFASCKDKNALPAGILNREKMQSVLWDVIRAGAFTNTFIKKDSTKNLVLEDAKLQNEAFAVNHVTKDEFYASYDYYKLHPELMADLLDSIQANNNRVGRPKNLPHDHRFSGGHFADGHMPFLKDSIGIARFNRQERIKDSIEDAKLNPVVPEPVKDTVDLHKFHHAHGPLLFKKQ
jgi:hypothetical protein